MKYEIYYDQDEVMNYLARYIVEHFNKEHNQNYDWQTKESYYFGDNDGLEEYKEYFHKLMNSPGTFIEPDIVEDTELYMHKFVESEHEVYIVTCPQWNDSCMIEKVEWIKKHLPWFKMENIYMCKRKEKLAAPNRILLDDNLDNLDKWRKAGGLAVAFAKPWNKEWDGPRVSTHKEFYEFVTKLEEREEEHLLRLYYQAKGQGYIVGGGSNS